MKMLATVLQEVRELKNMVNNVRFHQNQEECPYLPVELPLKTHYEFEQLESFLEDNTNFKSMVFIF